VLITNRVLQDELCQLLAVTVSAAFSRHRQRLLTDLGSLRQRTEDVAHARLSIAPVAGAVLITNRVLQDELCQLLRDKTRCSDDGNTGESTE
jgi:hypothetical protein